METKESQCYDKSGPTASGGIVYKITAAFRSDLFILTRNFILLLRCGTHLDSIAEMNWL
jgi:hypothetical protein